MDQQRVQKWDQRPSLQDMSIHDQQSNPIDRLTAIRRYSKRNAGIQQPMAQAQIFETFELQNKKQSKTDMIFIVMCLKMHFVFSSLNEAQLNHLASTMFHCKLPKGQTIMKQGDQASSFFIIERGRIQVSINNAPRKELLTGNGFGELALLYNAPRSATCLALEDCFLWGIDRNTFRTTIEQIMRSESEKNRKYLENVKFFNQLTPQQKDAIGGILISQKFIKDQIIVNEGDQASSFYIIIEGKVGIFKDGVQVRELGINESFGEQALLAANAVRAMTVKAIEGDTKVLALGRDIITKILGDQVEHIIYKNQCKWIIQKSRFAMPLNQLDKFLDSLTIRRLQAGQEILKKGDSHGNLVILLDVAGVDSRRNVYKSGEILCEDTLLIEGTHEKDYFMKDDGHIAIMDYHIFMAQFGKHQQILETHSLEGISLVTQVKDKTLSELLYIQKLGSGQFGSVYLCKYSDLDTLFALKFVTRAHIKQFGISKHVNLERQVLAMLDHPFIMRFYRSYKDDENIYFLTEFINGIELFDAIRIIGLLSKFDSQFYLAQMIIQMEYLHTQHSVIYRDIKPENLMVDHDGYLKLIDMGTSKPCPAGHKAFTIIGTPHYMAPEVISGKGYNQMADLWGVGVCLYEFICGGLPFGENAEDPFEIYKEIVKKTISYPTYMSDKSAKVIIEQLLSKIPEVRLGGSYSTLKQNEWFKGFNWDQLLAKKIQPPMIPDKPMKGAIPKNNIPVLEQISQDTANLKKVQACAKDAEWDNIF